MVTQFIMMARSLPSLFSGLAVATTLGLVFVITVSELPTTVDGFQNVAVPSSSWTAASSSSLTTNSLLSRQTNRFRNKLISSSSPATIPSSPSLSALPGPEMEMLVNHLAMLHPDPTITTTAVTPSLLESSNVDDLSTTISSFSQLVADAAADVATKSDSGGWWKSYLNIFKTTIEFVHNTIDPPLRAAGFTQTWGLSIALFTAGVRSLLIPLSIQQSKSSEYIKLLKPYTTEIKERFKDNEDARNRATAKLYEDANQNPLSGCLLSLAQLPIFLGLYRGVRLLALDGKLDEPFLWIPSLQGPVTAETDFRGMDWLTKGWELVDGTWTPPLGWETTLAFCIMPIILVLGQSLTMQALQPPVDNDATDEEKEQLEKTQGILKFLPLMIGFFSLQVPAGLTIYWFTSNLFTLTQSLAVRKYYELNPPEINLPDYWDSLDKIEEMSADEKRKMASAGIAVGPKFEDLVVEANFHTVVERRPLRAESAAWQRVVDGSAAARTNGDANGDIASDLQAWARTASTPSNGAQMNGTSAAQAQTQAEPAVTASA